MMDPLLNGTHIRVLGEAGSTKVIRVFKDDGYDAIADQSLAPICKGNAMGTIDMRRSR